MAVVIIIAGFILLIANVAIGSLGFMAGERPWVSAIGALASVLAITEGVSML